MGGLGSLVDRLGESYPSEANGILALVPSLSDGEAFWAFIAYVGVQSWSSGNTEGNGYIAQRILATRSERDARLASLWYAIAHFALRPWPWILVGLIALVDHPGLADPEEGYVRVMLARLPAGMLGLMIASFLAAFMSTIDTQLNWGASYLTHDLYKRFLNPNASEATLVRVARGSVVLLALVGAATTLGMDSVAEAWKLLASIGAGTGLILLLRWLWWRINAWSEISVMLASLFASNAIELFADIKFPFSLALVVAFSVPVSLGVTFLTAPEDESVLRAFYERVRPVGWWEPVARAAGLPHRRLGARPVFEVLAATIGVYAGLLGTGWMILGSPGLGLFSIALAILLLAWVVRGGEEMGVHRE